MNKAYFIQRDHEIQSVQELSNYELYNIQMLIRFDNYKPVFKIEDYTFEEMLRMF